VNDKPKSERLTQASATLTQMFIDTVDALDTAHLHQALSVIVNELAERGIGVYVDTIRLPEHEKHEVN